MSASNWPSMVSNLVWAAVGVHALVQARHAVRAAVVERWRTLPPVAADPSASDDTVAVEPADGIALAA